MILLGLADARHMPLRDSSIDAIVCDPPYGLEFMGKDWDAPWESDSHVGQRMNEGWSEVVMADGADRLRRPSFEKQNNVRCRTCNRWRLSSNPCTCPTPDFPNLRAANMQAYQAWCTEWAAEALRVLKPGGFLLASGGTRTYHRLASGIEDAGFEIRDMLEWLYGSGFPKSLDVSKAIDRTAGRIGHNVVEIKRVVREAHARSGRTLAQLNEACGFEASGYLRESSTWATVLPSADKWATLRAVLGLGDELDHVFASAEREVLGMRPAVPGVAFTSDGPDELPITAPATEDAARWEGWGTALKPAWEPIVVARKPLVGTVAQNVLQHGTGALNIDASRIEGTGNKTFERDAGERARDQYRTGTTIGPSHATDLGRWPANVLLDEEAAALLDAQTGVRPGMAGGGLHSPDYAGGMFGAIDSVGTARGDAGGASRFFFVSRGQAPEQGTRFWYTSKASRTEREAGLAHLMPKRRSDGRQKDIENPRLRTSPRRNDHPTVKPVDLMRWMVRLVTPPGGIVLDPFMGSGSTGMAALDLAGLDVPFRFVGLDLDPWYVELSRNRIANRHLLTVETRAPAEHNPQGSLL